MASSILSKLIQFYLNLGPSVTRRGNFTFSGVKKTSKPYVEKVPLIEDIPPEVPLSDPDVFSFLRSPDLSLIPKIIEGITQGIQDVKKEKVYKKLEEVGTKSLDLHNLKIIQPTNDPDTYKFSGSVLLDTKNNKLVPASLYTTEGVVKLLDANIRDREARDQFLAQMTLTLPVIYNPTLEFGIIPHELHNAHEVFNISQPQPWKAFEYSKRVPKLFVKFMEHLFPNETERLEVMQWLYVLAHNKNEYALVLTGVKGCGKGIFSTLAKRVAGTDAEVFEATESMGLNSHFNSELKGTRFCFFDEVCIDANNVNRIKRLLNKTATLEGKGKNPEKGIKLWTSFMIANNYPYRNNVDFDDRRFLIPQISTKTLNEAWGKENTDLFIKKIETDDQYICDIVEYIKPRINGKFSPKTEPYKGPFFYKLVWGSLTEWQRSVLEAPFKLGPAEFKGGTTDEVRLSSIKKLHKSKFGVGEIPKGQNMAQATTVSQFLENYRHGMDKIKVGEMLGAGTSEPTIVYTREYLKLKGEIV